METQLHRSHGHDHDDPADLHAQEERIGGAKSGTMKKVKDKLKATIHGGYHKDEAQAVNDSHVVRSGLAEPTVMGTPVLAEDLYATRSDIVDTPVRPFANPQDEEKHHTPPPLSTNYETHLTDLPPHTYGQDVKRCKEGYGEPPPLSTGYGTELPQVGFGQDVNRELWESSIGNPTSLEEHGTPPTLAENYETQLPHVGHYTYGQDVIKDQFKGGVRGLKDKEGYGEPPPLFTGFGAHPGDNNAGYEAHVTDLPHDTGVIKDHHTMDTGGKEVGITGVLKSFDKMKVFDEHEHKHDTNPLESDKNEPDVYTGSHDQFAPEPVESPPLDTIAANPSNPNSSYTKRVSAIAERVAALKDTVVSKLSSSGDDNISDTNRVSPKTYKKSSLPTDLSHKVADTLSDTLGPVYEKVAEAGSSVMSKVQGSGHDDTGGKGVTVKEYLVDTFKPGDDDKVLSEAITQALHRGKGNPQSQETTTTTYVIRDEGKRRLQDTGN